MSHILNTTEIVGTIQLPQGKFELCALGDATYKQSSTSLVVGLEANLRPCLGSETVPVKPEWMPAPQTVTEHVAIEEAAELARDIFRRWVRKVREAAPGLRAPTF